MIADSQLIVKVFLNNLDEWNWSLILQILQIYTLVFLLQAWYNGIFSLNKRY